MATKKNTQPDPLAASREYMLDDLKRSGLKPSDLRVQALPIDPRNEATRSAAEGSGFSGYKWPAYRIHSAEGSWGDRIAVPEAERKLLGKYRNQPGVNGLYFSSEGAMDAFASAPVKVIVEGQKKARKAELVLGLPVMGTPGCWNLTPKDSEDPSTKMLHPGLEALLNPGDRVMVCLDGDIADPHKNVGKAAREIQQLLEDQGVQVEFMLLPNGMGFDDWAVREGFKRDDPKALAAFNALQRIDPQDPDRFGPDASEVIEELLLRAPRADEEVLTERPVQYAVHGLIERGQRGVVGGMGNAGKTTMLINLGICHALGKPFMGRVVQEGSMVLLSGDDAQDELDEALRRHLLDGGYSKREREKVESRLRLVSVKDAGGNKLIEPADYGKSFVPTSFARSLRAALGKVPDLVGVVIDTARQFSGQDSSNEQAMTALVGISSALTALPQRPYSAVTHHMNKTGAKAGSLNAYDLTGSGTLIDSNRFVLIVHQLKDSEVEELLSVSSVSGSAQPLSWVGVLAGRGSLLTPKAAPFFYTRSGQYACALQYQPDARMPNAEERKKGSESLSEQEQVEKCKARVPVIFALSKFKGATLLTENQIKANLSDPQRPGLKAALQELLASGAMRQEQTVKDGKVVAVKYGLNTAKQAAA